MTEHRITAPVPKLKKGTHVEQLYGIVDDLKQQQRDDARVPSRSPIAIKGTRTAAAAQQPVGKIDINLEIARERKIRNDDAEQDIRLKRSTLNRLFTFLSVETAVIFIFAMLQATHALGFALEEWSFKLLISATLAQITAMLFVAVRYLFPKKPIK